MNDLNQSAAEGIYAPRYDKGYVQRMAMAGALADIAIMLFMGQALRKVRIWREGIWLKILQDQSAKKYYM